MSLFRDTSKHPRGCQVPYATATSFEKIPDYEGMSQEEAKSHFQWFMSVKNERQLYFETRYRELNNHAALSYDEHGVEAAWIWLNAIAGTTEMHQQYLKLDQKTQLICFDAGVFIGSCLMSGKPARHWHLEERKKSVYVNRPTISITDDDDVTVDPYDLVEHSLTRYLNGDSQHTLMVRFASYREEWPKRIKPGYPPEMTYFVDDISIPDDEYDRWQIGISSEAEDYLGEPVFAKLESYFAGIPGVQDLIWEDREIFSFTTTRSDMAELRADFFNRFLMAAKDAHGQGHAK